MQCHVAHTLFDYQRNLRRGKWYIASFLVHFKLMQDARNEEIGLQPEAFVPRPPGYALRPVTGYTFALSISLGNLLIV